MDHSLLTIRADHLEVGDFFNFAGVTYYVDYVEIRKKTVRITYTEEISPRRKTTPLRGSMLMDINAMLYTIVRPKK